MKLAVLPELHGSMLEDEASVERDTNEVRVAPPIDVDPLEWVGVRVDVLEALTVGITEMLNPRPGRKPATLERLRAAVMMLSGEVAEMRADIRRANDAITERLSAEYIAERSRS